MKRVILHRIHTILPLAAAATVNYAYGGKFALASCDDLTSKLLPANTRFSNGHTYNANNPTEDRWVMAQIQTSQSKSLLDVACVMDGHGGWQVSEFVSQRILSRFSNMLQQQQSLDDDQQVDGLITDLFNQLESDYISSIKNSYALGYTKLILVFS